MGEQARRWHRMKIKQICEPTDYGVCQVTDSIILQGTAVYGQSSREIYNF